MRASLLDESELNDYHPSDLIARARDSQFLLLIGDLFILANGSLLFSKMGMILRHLLVFEEFPGGIEDSSAGIVLALKLSTRHSFQRERHH